MDRKPWVGERRLDELLFARAEREKGWANTKQADARGLISSMVLNLIRERGCVSWEELVEETGAPCEWLLDVIHDLERQDQIRMEMAKPAPAREVYYLCGPEPLRG